MFAHNKVCLLFVLLTIQIYNYCNTFASFGGFFLEFGAKNKKYRIFEKKNAEIVAQYCNSCIFVLSIRQTTNNAMSTTHKYAVSPEDWAYNVILQAARDAAQSEFVERCAQQTSETQEQYEETIATIKAAAEELRYDWASSVTPNEIHTIQQAQISYEAVFDAVEYELMNILYRNNPSPAPLRGRTN
jgi:predicted transcriptional regulator